MNKVITFLVLVTFLSCGSNPKLERYRRLPEYSSKKLLENNIIPIKESYKLNYYSILHYLYNNRRNDFLKIFGDYYNLTHPKYSSVSILGSFHTSEKDNNYMHVSLVVYFKNSDQIEDLNINVSSSKHGKIDLSQKYPIRYNELDNYIRYTFIKEFKLDKRRDALKIVHDDIITVEIDNYKYELLNPELNLN